MTGLGAIALVSVLAGCDLVAPGAPSGTVTGVVLYNGAPAAGKVVNLLNVGQKTATNAQGRYTFTSVTPGKYQVLYQSPSEGLPNEVEKWYSKSFDLTSGSGKQVPPFDVATNGLLYPDNGMSLIVKEKSAVPFHWTPHPQAQQYRVRLTGANEFRWDSEWKSAPWALFEQEVAPGRYQWAVEIDGGDRGNGFMRGRQVDLGPE
jgi:hypothetical protein